MPLKALFHSIDPRSDPGPTTATKVNGGAQKNGSLFPSRGGTTFALFRDIFHFEPQHDTIAIYRPAVKGTGLQTRQPNIDSADMFAYIFSALHGENTVHSHSYAPFRKFRVSILKHNKNAYQLPTRMK